MLVEDPENEMVANGAGSPFDGTPNILLITGSLQGGGAERVISDMANYWANKCWNVTFATWCSPEVADFYSLAPGIKRAWLDVYSPNDSVFSKIKSNLGRIQKLRGLIRKTKPDIILSFLTVSNLLTITACMGLKQHVVISERNNPILENRITIPWKILRRLFYAHADTVIVQTNDLKLWIDEHCRIKSMVIPNPLREMPKLSYKRENLIVAVGNLSKQKGFDLLLRAFSRIASEFNEWRVAIVGQGNEYEKLMQLRNDLMLEHRVDFIGQSDEVEKWMAQSGLVVQPSRFEGFPNVLLEAMSMGAPVISADCEFGPSDIIQDGVNGRLVPVEDVSTLARVIAEMICQPALREQMGLEAMKVRETYKQDKIMEQWEQSIFKLQGSSKKQIG